MKKFLFGILRVGLVWLMLFSQKGVQPVQAENPIVDISTVDQLISIGSSAANLAGSYHLTQDIDLSTVVNWTPLGNATTPFSGSLDGGDHAIRNLVLADTQDPNQGLFGVIGSSASVSNLRVENATVTAGDYTGILAGVNHGALSRVSAQGIITGGTEVGGLVGENDGSITTSFAIATVSGRTYNGGLVGRNLSSGTLTNTYAASKVSGSVTNNYIGLDGHTYISIPHNDAYITNSFTLEAWFQWTASDRTATEFITGQGTEKFEIHTGGGAGANGIRFIPVPSATVNRTQDASASYQDVQKVLQPGWNHVAVVWDFAHEQAMVLLNGIPQTIYHGAQNMGTTATVPLLNPNTNPLTGNLGTLFIGARNDNGNQPFLCFEGDIADVRFWNTVRTPGQISADKYKQLTGSEPNLIGYWKLDETSGNTVADSSPLHNTGTIEHVSTCTVSTSTPTPATDAQITRVQSPSVNGGLVGENAGAVTNSYFDADVSGLSDASSGITPLHTDQMMQRSNFPGWFSGPVWNNSDGYSYPSPFTYTLPVSITAVTPTPVTYGSSYTVSYAVPQHYLGTPAGTVTVSDGDGQTCAANLTPGNPSTGSCSLSSSAGSKTLTASYTAPGGDTIFTASSGTGGQTVNQADQAPLTLTAPAALTYGQTASLSATGGSGTGALSYSTGASTGCSVTGSTLSVTDASGTCLVTAARAADTDYHSVSSTAVAVTLNQADTTTTITSDTPGSTVYGEVYPITVSVSGPGGTPSGTVAVRDGTSLLCTIPLAGGAGSCSLTSSQIGSLDFTATYSGDGNYNASSDTKAHSGEPGQTQVTLADPLPDPTGSGETVTFAVTVNPVAPADGTPGGTVDVLREGSVLCSATLSNMHASCTYGGLTTGAHVLTARYNGDDDFSGSVSAEINHSVQDIALDDNQTSTSHTGVGNLATSGGSAPYAYRLQTSGRICTPANGAGNDGFTLAGNVLQRKATTVSGAYPICVESEDATGGILQKAFSILINDPPALDDSSFSRLTVGITGTEVGSLTVTAGRAPFIYALEATGPTCTAQNATGNAAFAFVSNTLTRRSATPTGTYPICVQVTDAEGDAAQQAYAITVTNGPTALALSRTTVSTLQTEVGSLSVTDGLSPISYSLQTSGEACNSANGADNPSFVINAGRLERRAGTGSGTYSICAQAADANGMVTQAAFTIQVTLPPSELQLSNQAVKTSQELVGTLSTANGLFPYTYSLATSGSVCNPGHAAANALFAVAGNGLKRLPVAAAGTYTVCLQTTDANGEALQKTFAVTVTPDAPPPAAWTVTLTADRIIDSDPIGTLVGTLVSSRSGATYSLVDLASFPFAENFSISANGELVLAQTLTPGTQATFPIRVRAQAPDGEIKDVDSVITAMKNGALAGAEANPDANTLQQGSAGVHVDVLGNDQVSSNASGWASLQIVGYPHDGSAEISSTNATSFATASLPSAPGILYIPNAGFYGVDMVTYRACDDLDYCVTGSVEFTVKQGDYLYYFPRYLNQ